MPLPESYDVAVVGGGAAGVAAAISASRLGARTILFERYGFLGGAATNALVLTYCGLYYRRDTAEFAVGGVALDVLGGLEVIGEREIPRRSPTGNWILPFNPEALKHVLDQIVGDAGVTIASHAFVTGAQVEDGSIKSIAVADHQGSFDVEAAAFVDASGESDLAARAAPGTIAATAPTQLFAASLCARITGIAPGTTIDRAAMRRICDHETFRAGGARLRPDGGVMIFLEDGDLWWMGVDAWTDGLTSSSLGKAESSARKLAWRFMAELRTVPGFEAASLIATGPQIGVRETRHPASVAVLAGDALLAGERCADSIGRAVWPAEMHDKPGGPTLIPIGGDGYADIPSGVIRSSGCENLWLGGRTVGADRVAFGSVRVMGTAFVTGQAAGTAAALHVDRKHGYADLRAELEAHGALI